MITDLNLLKINITTMRSKLEKYGIVNNQK